MSRAVNCWLWYFGGLPFSESYISGTDSARTSYIPFFDVGGQNIGRRIKSKKEIQAAVFDARSKVEHGLALTNRVSHHT